MNPVEYSHRKQNLKLISSKFVYQQTSQLPKINRVTAGVLAKNRGTLLGVGALMSSFGSKPTFLKKKLSRSQTFRLEQVRVNATGHNTAQALWNLTYSFFAYQFENSIITATYTKNQAISWALPACRTSSQANPLSFKCSIEEDNFDAICAVKYKARSLDEIIFLLRLAQIPIMPDSKNHA